MYLYPLSVDLILMARNSNYKEYFVGERDNRPALDDCYKLCEARVMA